MRWAFWRRWSGPRTGASDATSVDRPLPDGVGLGRHAGSVHAGPVAEPREPEPDDDGRGGATTRPGAFSGADPDAAQRPRPSPQPLADEPVPLDEALLARSGALVAVVVHAALSGGADAVRRAVPAQDELPRAQAAAAAATGALAMRLPALSGVDGAVVFDEDEADLLHAYADLLSERADARRAQVATEVPRERLLVVAHLAAAAAVGDAASEPTLLLLGGIPAVEQLLAACVLLAQTCADGGGGADELTGEVADLFG